MGNFIYIKVIERAFYILMKKISKSELRDHFILIKNTFENYLFLKSKILITLY